MEVNSACIIPIDKLMYWKAGNWIKYENKMSNIFIRLHCDQMLIISDNKVLESLNMNGKIKGIFKGDVLIVIVCTRAQEIRKLKFQITNNATRHLQILGEHFAVVSHKSTLENCNFRYRKVEDIFKNVMEDFKDNNESSNLPSNFKDFVKLCLLDPSFPQVVHETQKIIKSEMMKKS